MGWHTVGMAATDYGLIVAETVLVLQANLRATTSSPYYKGRDATLDVKQILRGIQAKICLITAHLMAFNNKPLQQMYNY